MEGFRLPSRTRSFHQTKTDALIGAMSCALYIILGITFFLCLSINNVFLRLINRTLATTLLTFTAMTFAMHAVYGGFDVGRKKNKPVISAMIAGTFITDLVTYLQLQIMNVNDNYNEHLVLFGPDFLNLLLCLLIQILVIILFVRIGNQVFFYFNPPRSCLLVLGSPGQEKDLREKIGRYRLQWRVDDAVLYNVPDLEQRIEKADVIFLGKVPEGAKFALLKICYDDRKDVMCKAQLEDIMLCNARPAIVDDAAFLAMEYNKITVFQRVAKRLGDIFVSIFALIFFSPFIAVIALLIHLEDGGPVIFRQSRLTADGKTFTIRKFRTMTPRSEQDEVQVSVRVDDPRITKIGAFLRRYRLDEIPQFFNILIGDMSLVGPRPEMMSNVARYKMNLPAFVYREKMKAGLTGYAQIEGRYNTSAEDKLMLDMMYIESFSVWLDVKLLLRTFTIIFKKDSTEGFRNEPVRRTASGSVRTGRTGPVPTVQDKSSVQFRTGRTAPIPVVSGSSPGRGYNPPGQASAGNRDPRRNRIPQPPQEKAPMQGYSPARTPQARPVPPVGYAPPPSGVRPPQGVPGSYRPPAQQPAQRSSSGGYPNPPVQTINQKQEKQYHEHNASHYGGGTGIPVRRQQADRPDRPQR